MFLLSVRSRRRVAAALGTLALSGSVLAGCASSSSTAGVMADLRDLGPATAASVPADRPAEVVAAYSTRTQLGELSAAGMEIWYVDQTAKKVFGAITRDQLPAFERLGLTPRLVQRTKLSNQFDTGYHTYDQIKTELKALAAKHPEIARFIDVGDSWEKTQGLADRDIVGLRIGKGDLASKPAVLFCGNHHAREIVTPEIVLQIIHMLIDGYGQDPDITHFVENRDIVLIPMVNPDGHRLATENHDWRKNTNTTTGGGTQFGVGPSGPGVDLNRNYGYKWGGAGASTNPKDATFRGPGAFSEPETRAMKSLVESRKFAFLMTYHSYSNLILWPWGHSDAPPPDKRLPAIGMKLGALSGYKPEQSTQLYPTTGDTTDWAFGEHGILSYTTEIGSYSDGFDPPYSKLPTFWKQNEPGARLLLSLAGNPDHCFGPELSQVAVRSGMLDATLPEGVTTAEYFVGRPGPDGSGLALSRGQAKLANVAPGALVLVHAKNAQGAWGPLKAAFNR